MALPRVSVAIPNYNYARFLPQRIESVLGQTYTDFELILIDDGSTDGSVDVMKRYLSDPRVTALVESKRNSFKMFQQWNKGVSYARGEYVWIAESDDYADPRLLERLVGVLDANPNVGLAYCQSNLVDPEGVLLGSELQLTASLDEHRWLADYVADGREECRKYFIRRCIIPNASAVVFRRELYQRVGGADERMMQSGDWMTWSKMVLESDIAFVAEPLNFYRKHQTRTRRTVWTTGRMNLEFYKVMGFIASRVDPDPDALREARAVMRSVWLNPAYFGRWSYGMHLRILPAAVRFDRQVIIPFLVALLRNVRNQVLHRIRGAQRLFKRLIHAQ